MHKARRAAMVAIALVLVAGALIYSERRSGSPATIVGVVRATEVRVEPEVNGQLVSIAVKKGVHVHAGDVLARLSAVELTAQADQARAALASAAASRDNVYAGVRREQVELSEGCDRQGRRPPRLRAGPAQKDQHTGTSEL